MDVTQDLQAAELGSTLKFYGSVVAARLVSGWAVEGQGSWDLTTSKVFPVSGKTNHTRY